MEEKHDFEVGQHVYVIPGTAELWKALPAKCEVVYIIDNKEGNRHRYLYEVEIPGEASHYFRWAEELYTDAIAACKPLKERVEEELGTLTRYLEALNEFSKNG